MNNQTATNLGFKDNVLGQANCAKEDPRECHLTAVSMTDKSTGDFAGSYGLPDTIEVN